VRLERLGIEQERKRDEEGILKSSLTHIQICLLWSVKRLKNSHIDLEPRQGEKLGKQGTIAI